MLVSFWNDTDRECNDWKLHSVDENEDWFLRGIINFHEIECFSSIEIETINRCNNDCSFCPVSMGNDIRKPLRMKEGLFKKIIQELKEKEYKGFLSLFSNNEPLLDVRIFEWIAYAKKELPDATHALYTNGTLLDLDKYNKLTKYLDLLVIDNYNDELCLNDNISEIFKRRESESICKTRVLVRKKNQVLENRGGIAPNKPTADVYMSRCVLPFFQMVIRPDGKVSRCCQDAYGIDTLGDVNESTVWEVWNGNAFTTLRKLLMEFGRRSVKTCRSCDQFGLNNYYPVEWEGTYYNQLVDWIRKKKNEGRAVYINEEKNTINLLNSLRLNEVNVDGVRNINSKIDWQREAVVLLHYDYEWIRNAQKDNINVVEDYIVYDWSKYPNVGRVSRMDFRRVLNEIKIYDAKHKVIIFGAGERARQLIEGYRLKPYMIVDNDSKKCDSLFMGIAVRPAQSLDGNTVKDCVVVNATGEYIDVITQLQKQNVALEQVMNGLILL